MDPKSLEFTNTPNILTLFRILCVPVVVTLMFFKDPTWDLVAAWTFGAAAITDILDGWVARRQNIVTVYGKLMDPLADKFLVAGSLIMLLFLGRVHPVLVILLICRELLMTGLRSIAIAEGIVISASTGGKIKAVTQMVGIPFLIANRNFFGLPTYAMGEWLLYLSLLISLGSALQYVVRFFAELRARLKIKRLAKKAPQA
jgi:CDP-diacylglycerol--glycerol-3-phosphate 3-phosphatidyltransferase